jgi:predicted membrane protein
MSQSAHLWWGLTLIVVGVLFLLDNMGTLDFGYILSTYWPLIFIIWGAGLLFGRQTTSPSSEGAEKSSEKVFGDTNEGTRTNEIKYATVFGDCSVRVSSDNFRGGTVSTVFGDTVVDCSAATLSPGEQRLNISGVFGDTQLWLPKEAAFRLTSSTVFGDIRCKDQKQEGFSPSLRYESPGYSSAERRLRVDISQVFGDVTVEPR